MTETYYAILGIPRDASADAIKARYRELIREVHPDALPNASNYWKQQAEERTKDINEAYKALSDPEKRRIYDQQLDAYFRSQQPSQATNPNGSRTQQAHQGPTAANQTQSQPTGTNATQQSYAGSPTPGVNTKEGWGVWCLFWGVVWSAALLSRTTNHGIMFLLAFGSFGLAALRYRSQIHTFLSRRGITGPLQQICLSLFAICVLLGLVLTVSDGIQGSEGPSDHPSQSGLVPIQPSSQQRSSAVVSSQTNPSQEPIVLNNSEGSSSDKTTTVAGFYIGTVHNQTAQLSAQFAVNLIQRGRNSPLSGCAQVKLPLYGSGSITGSTSGGHVQFEVANIVFQGNASDRHIDGSYQVHYTDRPNEVGNFHLERLPKGSSYRCQDGILAESSPPSVSPSRSEPILVGRRSVSEPIPIDNPSPLDQSKLLRDDSGAESLRSQPDLSGVSASDRQSIESACSGARLVQGAAAYHRCLQGQLSSLVAGPSLPDLSAISSSDRQSIESACSGARLVQGAAAYHRCLREQVNELLSVH